MIIGICGITCIGKTYCVRYISNNYNFKAVNTLRTRQKRNNDNSLGSFLTNNELDTLINQGKIAYSFNVFGSRYAYLNDDIFSKENMVFEMHYTTILDFKKIRKDLKIIYILPKSIKVVENMIKNRCSDNDEIIMRTNEIHEQLKEIENNDEILKMVDYIIYNNYDDTLLNEIDAIMKKIGEQ